MGLEKKTTSFRMSPRTLEQLSELQSGFSPLVEDRSSTLRLVINFVWGMFFSPHTLQAMSEKFQRLLRMTSQCDPQMRLTFSTEPPASTGSVSIAKYRGKS